MTDTTRCPSTTDVRGYGPFGRPWTHTVQCVAPAGHDGLHDAAPGSCPGLRPWADNASPQPEESHA